MPSSVVPLTPLPYHERMAECLERREPALWHLYSSDQRRRSEAEAVRLALLKCAYRLEPGAHPAIHQVAAEVAARLGIDAQVTLYQSQQPAGLGAEIYYLPGEAHIALIGPLADALSPTELRAVMAHELAHFRFDECNQGKFLTAARLLQALARDPRAEPSHVRSAYLYAQYTEVYADRAAAGVTGDALAAVSALVKTETGVREVSAEAYLRQAEEIFAQEQSVSTGQTHPETFIRARALQLWSKQGAQADGEITRMIEGPLALDTLDLPGQERLTQATRALLGRLFAPAWARSAEALGWARQMFPDFDPEQTDPGPHSAPTATDTAAPGAAWRFDHASVQDYACALLLDFAAVDPALEDAPLAAGFCVAETLGISDRLAEMAVTELKRRKKAIEKIRTEAAGIVERAGATRPGDAR